jgi:glycosyltransferase involved in cell wall biosynthesis
MVFPSLFEGFGMPISEAFVMGAPTACSNVTSLPEQADDAALIFDPQNIDEIARTLFRLWTDDALREDLAVRARKRVSSLKWERTARIFRAHYRRLSGRQLAPQDQLLVRTSLSTCITT